MKRKTVAVYGVNAALAVAAHRPEAIQRVLHHRSRRKALGPLLKAAAARRRPYREVLAEDLERVAKTRHHEGVVVVADPLPLAPLEALAATGGVLIALDGVGNPHNLGAILRSAAWFGVSGVIFPALAGQATLSGAAMRVAQGGAEVVPCCQVDALAPALRWLGQTGFAIVGADQHAERDLSRGGPPRPCCLVLGSESEGLTAAVRAACTSTVSIPGTGAVESLNVAVAAAVLLASVR